jgi:hypothetical protein
MELKDKIDVLSKLIDALYKKLIVLLAISGGFGAYAIKFIQHTDWIGYIFAIAFVFVSIGVFITYIKLNMFVKELERINDE